MQDIALPLQDFLKSMDADAAKAYQVRKLHDAFAKAILEVYGAQAAPLVLRHVQAVYFMDDDGVYVGQSAPLRLLRVYTDDPTVRADLDARQEFIKMRLAEQGHHVDRLRLHASTFGMKERTPYADLLAQMAAGESVEPATDDDGAAYEEASSADLIKRLQTLKVALCQVFGEDADTVVKSINAADVVSRGTRGYAVTLWVPDAFVDTLQAVEEPLCARLRDLGLKTCWFAALEAEDWMQAHQVYPAQSAPVVVKR